MTITKKWPLDAVLFDLDGTLVDTAPDFILCVNALCRQHGIEPPDAMVFRTQVSHGASAMIQTAFNITPEDDRLPGLITEFLALYENNICVESKLFDGFDELLTQLDEHGIVWGIITNKPRRFAAPLVEALKLNSACLICPDDVEQRKPHPESMDLACTQLSLTATNCLYVGDHRRDIEAGKAANMYTAAAAFGYVDPSDPAGEWRADFYASTPASLQTILNTHFDVTLT
ncbi:MAG: HAD-IA family hydrolase [Pseudomonadota bacterium]